MTTPAEQEAERRYLTPAYRAHFIAGAEWSESRYRELLEAAREYRGSPSAQLEADELGLVGARAMVCVEDEIIGRLLAAAAALEEATDE